MGNITVLKIHFVDTFEQPSSKIFDPGNAPANLLIYRGLTTWAEFMQKLSAERAMYQAMLQKMR